MTDRDWRAKTAWRNAAVAVCLNIVGMPMEIAIVHSVPEMSSWPAIASMGISIVLLVVLLVRRRDPSLALGNLIFLLNIAGVIAAVWVLDGGFARSGRMWTPFQEYKLGMVTVALLGPEAWVGALSICAYAVAAFIQLATFAPEVRIHLALGEPWATLAFTVFAGVLLVYRLRRSALELEVAHARARVEATTHLAKVLLAVRDLANTPLQTIAFAAEAARRLDPATGPSMDRIERSLARLRVLDRRLRGHDDQVEWTGGEESLDALEIATSAARKAREGH